MNDFLQRSDRKAVRLLLLLVFLLIVYGSLYPFRFSLPGKPLFQWKDPGGLTAIRDVVINLGLYFPAGFLIYYAAGTRSRSTRLLSATLIALLVSVAIEFLQSFDAGRVSSSIDITLNSVGALLGAVFASLLQWRIPDFSRIRPHPVPAALLGLLITTHLFPFFPRVQRPQLLAMGAQFLGSGIVISGVGFATVKWLAVRMLLASILNRPPRIFEFAAFCMLIPAGLLIIDQSPTLTESCGALLALFIGHWWNPRPAWFAPVLLLDVILRELMPFHWSAFPQSFHWMPLAGILGAGPASAILFLQKCFLYGVTLWCLEKVCLAAWHAAAILCVLLLILEGLQVYMPGRTPEVTDSLIVVVLAACFALLRQRGLQASTPYGMTDSLQASMHNRITAKQ